MTQMAAEAAVSAVCCNDVSRLTTLTLTGWCDVIVADCPRSQSVSWTVDGLAVGQGRLSLGLSGVGGRVWGRGHMSGVGETDTVARDRVTSSAGIDRAATRN